jgi:hypothetical protein
METDGEYTLERVKARRPEAYRLARNHLEAGLSFNAIVELCKPMSKHTVMAIAEEMGLEKGLTADDVGRRVFLKEARRGSVLGALACAKILQDPGEDVPLRDMALATKVLTEASELMAGLPTSRVELVGVKVEDALGELEALNAK